MHVAPGGRFREEKIAETKRQREGEFSSDRQKGETVRAKGWGGGGGRGGMECG